MKIVLDTNVLVSGLLSPHGPPAQVLALVLNGSVTVQYDNRVLAEYREVLGRPKFGFPKEGIEPILEYLQTEGEFVTAEPTNRPFSDEGDRPFYEVAVTGRCEYLVTGNKAHFPKENFVKTPSEFLQIYRRSGPTRETRRG